MSNYHAEESPWAEAPRTQSSAAGTADSPSVPTQLSGNSGCSPSFTSFADTLKNEIEEDEDSEVEDYGYAMLDDSGWAEQDTEGEESTGKPSSSSSNTVKAKAKNSTGLSFFPASSSMFKLSLGGKKNHSESSHSHTVSPGMLPDFDNVEENVWSTVEDPTSVLGGTGGGDTSITGVPNAQVEYQGSSEHFEHSESENAVTETPDDSSDDAETTESAESAGEDGEAQEDDSDDFGNFEGNDEVETDVVEIPEKKENIALPVEKEFVLKTPFEDLLNGIFDKSVDVDAILKKEDTPNETKEGSDTDSNSNTANPDENPTETVLPAEQNIPESHSKRLSTPETTLPSENSNSPTTTTTNLQESFEKSADSICKPSSSVETPDSNHIPEKAELDATYSSTDILMGNSRKYYYSLQRPTPQFYLPDLPSSDGSNSQFRILRWRNSAFRGRIIDIVTSWYGKQSTQSSLQGTPRSTGDFAFSWSSHNSHEQRAATPSSEHNSSPPLGHSNTQTVPTGLPVGSKRSSTTGLPFSFDRSQSQFLQTAIGSRSSRESSTEPAETPERPIEDSTPHSQHSSRGDLRWWFRRRKEHPGGGAHTQPSVDGTGRLVAQPEARHEAQPVAQSVAQHMAEPMAQPVAQPVAQKAPLTSTESTDTPGYKEKFSSFLASTSASVKKQTQPVTSAVSSELSNIGNSVSKITNETKSLANNGFVSQVQSLAKVSQSASGNGGSASIKDYYNAAQAAYKLKKVSDTIKKETSNITESRGKISSNVSAAVSSQNVKEGATKAAADVVHDATETAKSAKRRSFFSWGSGNSTTSPPPTKSQAPESVNPGNSVFPNQETLGRNIRSFGSNVSSSVNAMKAEAMPYAEKLKSSVSQGFNTVSGSVREARPKPSRPALNVQDSSDVFDTSVALNAAGIYQPEPSPGVEPNFSDEEEETPADWGDFHTAGNSIQSSGVGNVGHPVGQPTGQLRDPLNKQRSSLLDFESPSVPAPVSNSNAGTSPQALSFDLLVPQRASSSSKLPVQTVERKGGPGISEMENPGLSLLNTEGSPKKVVTQQEDSEADKLDLFATSTAKRSPVSPAKQTSLFSTPKQKESDRNSDYLVNPLPQLPLSFQLRGPTDLQKKKLSETTVLSPKKLSSSRRSEDSEVKKPSSLDLALNSPPPAVFLQDSHTSTADDEWGEFEEEPVETSSVADKPKPKTFSSTVVLKSHTRSDSVDSGDEFGDFASPVDPPASSEFSGAVGSSEAQAVTPSPALHTDFPVLMPTKK